MKSAVLLSVIFAAQAGAAIPAVMTAPGPLSSAEVTRVLAASRRALAGATFSTVPFSTSQLITPGPGPGAEILLDRDGRLAIARSTERLERGLVQGDVNDGAHGRAGVAVHRTVETGTVVLDFTGAGATLCSGGGSVGLVTRYHRLQSDGEWTVTARRHQPGAPGFPFLEAALALLQNPTAVRSDGTELVHGRRARVFTAAWEPPTDFGEAARTGDPAPNVSGEVRPRRYTQALLIDVRSMKPVRWEVRDDVDRTFGFEFVHERLDLRVPKAPPPKCVP